MDVVDQQFDDMNRLHSISKEIEKYIDDENISKKIDDNVKDYIPKTIFRTNTTEHWTDKIKEKFNENNFKTKLEAKNEYLNILKNNYLYKSIQFICQYSSKLNTANNNSDRIPNPGHFPEDCIVAVKPNEIVITDMDRNKIYSVPLTLIASWGVNSDVFLFVEKKSEKEFSKSYFNCNQTKLFKIIIDTYTNILVGKNMLEIMTERIDTCKLFETLPATKLKPGESIRIRQSTIYKKN